MDGLKMNVSLLLANFHPSCPTKMGFRSCICETLYSDVLKIICSDTNWQQISVAIGVPYSCVRSLNLAEPSNEAVYAPSLRPVLPHITQRSFSLICFVFF